MKVLDIVEMDVSNTSSLEVVDNVEVVVSNTSSV